MTVNFAKDKENKMKELLKDFLYAGVGAAFLTKEKIEALKDDMIDKGKLATGDGKQFVDDLLKKSETAKGQLDLWVNKRVEEKIKQLNLVTTDDIAELKRQIEELQVAINK